MARSERYSANYASTHKPDFKKLLAERNKKLLEFPVDSQVLWKHDPFMVLTVVGHDTKLGRLKVNNGQSYDPNEMEFYIPSKKS